MPDGTDDPGEPVTLEQVEALLVGDDEFEARSGCPWRPGTSTFPEVLGPDRQALEAGIPPEWWSHLIIDATTDTVVGFGGYKGPPTDGEVEIGYSIAPDFQRRGHATAAARSARRPRPRRGCSLVCAHTSARSRTRRPRVLQRCGFARGDDFEDRRDRHGVALGTPSGVRPSATTRAEPGSPTVLIRHVRVVPHGMRHEREERAEHAEPGGDDDMAEHLARAERGVVAR